MAIIVSDKNHDRLMELKQEMDDVAAALREESQTGFRDVKRAADLISRNSALVAELKSLDIGSPNADLGNRK